MIDELLAHAAQLRSDAQDLRRQARKATTPLERDGLFRSAADKFKEAIAVLERGLRTVRRQQTGHTLEVCSLLEGLSQTYGSLGGTWRDAGERARALEQYDKGNVYEEERREKCAAKDSYNMVQRLVIQVLINHSEEKFVAELNEVRQVIAQQFDQGRNDSWGLADLALLQILCGAEIDTALAELEKRNADATFYESAYHAIAALLEEGLGKGEPLGERLEAFKRLLQRKGGLA